MNASVDPNFAMQELGNQISELSIRNAVQSATIQLMKDIIASQRAKEAELEQELQAARAALDMMPQDAAAPAPEGDQEPAVALSD